jgi:hypothetical protein
MSFVLDNSVAMRWCFKTEAHPYADAILHNPRHDSDRADAVVL